MMYRLEMGRHLDLEYPKRFTEKIQWLKLYGRKPEYTTMVDKYVVKKYVAERIGEKYIIPTLGVWDKPEDIDFDMLPDKFVLKTTHGGGGGGVVVCKDKTTFDKQSAIKQLKNSLRQDIYRNFKEWPYKNVHRRIMAEEFMEDSSLNELRDYKFFCFNGQCKCFKVDFDRFIEHHANYYDAQGNILEFGELAYSPVYEKEIQLPNNLSRMVELANQLSSSIPFLRVDFYEVNGKVYFGELTFYPASGLGKFTSDEWDLRLGEWIKFSSDRFE